MVELFIYTGHKCKRGKEVRDLFSSLSVPQRHIDVDSHEGGMEAFRMIREHKLQDIINGIPFTLLMDGDNILDIQWDDFDPEIIELVINKI